MKLRRAALALAALLATGSVAAAHPHVLVDAKAEVVFDGEGRIASIRNIWQFDEAFTAFAVQGLDADNDGTLSDAELAPLAKVNIESLHEFGFFTWLSVDGKDHDFVTPTEYWLEFHGGRLTLFFTLPLAEPAKVGARTAIEVFDPEYFVAFTFVKDDPVRLDGAPAGCAATFKPPGELDSATMAVINAIPMDQPDLPPELEEAASVLSNLITVKCT